MERSITMLEPSDITLGSTIDYNGKTLLAKTKFVQGKEAKTSGLVYFMNSTNNEFLGFEEVNG